MGCLKTVHRWYHGSTISWSAQDTVCAQALLEGLKQVTGC